VLGLLKTFQAAHVDGSRGGLRWGGDVLPLSSDRTLAGSRTGIERSRAWAVAGVVIRLQSSGILVVYAGVVIGVFSLGSGIRTKDWIRLRILVPDCITGVILVRARRGAGRRGTGRARLQVVDPTGMDDGKEECEPGDGGSHSDRSAEEHVGIKNV